MFEMFENLEVAWSDIRIALEVIGWVLAVVTVGVVASILFTETLRGLLLALALGSLVLVSTPITRVFIYGKGLPAEKIALGSEELSDLDKKSSTSYQVTKILQTARERGYRVIYRCQSYDPDCITLGKPSPMSVVHQYAVAGGWTGALFALLTFLAIPRRAISFIMDNDVRSVQGTVIPASSSSSYSPPSYPTSMVPSNEVPQELPEGWSYRVERKGGH